MAHLSTNNPTTSTEPADRERSLESMNTPADLDVTPEQQATIAEIMQAHGYTGLKKTQAFAFNGGILDEGNDLLIAETGNGKTLTAEAVTLNHLKKGNRVAYLVPSTQLVWDKKEAIEEWAGDTYSIYSGRGKFRSGDVAVATFDSFYQAVLQGKEGARSLDALILDDFHEIYGGFRGTGIELAISAALNNDIDLYGISATLEDSNEIGEWMNANVHVSPEDRQTPIREFAVDSSTSSTKDTIVQTIKQNQNDGPFLVFCFAKTWTESRAEALAEEGIFDGPSKDRNLRRELSNEVDGLLTETHRDILDMLHNGVGYIHADLPGTVKKFVLDLYDEGEIQALTTTTSLAYGFDSPVKTVIVADCKRRGEYVGIYEYVQWAGRAARPSMGYEEGYCHVLADDPEEAAERFFEPTRELEDVHTHIDNDEQFRWLTLELIANGWDSADLMREFIHKSLYYHQMTVNNAWGQGPETKDEKLTKRLKNSTAWLVEQDFISEDATREGFSTKHLGRGAVNFHYNSFVDAELQSIKSFYEWADETASGDIRQLDYLHQVIDNFDLALTVRAVDGRLEPTLIDNGYEATEQGITAGLVRWYWMRNYSTERIEQETGVDPTYLPGLARKLSNTVRATQYVVEAAPNARKPDWHDSLVFRVDKGVREDAVGVAADINAMGRARIRFLRAYLEKMATQTLDLDSSESLGTLLTGFYDHTSSAEQFEEVLSEQVTMIGDVTAKNISEFIQSNDFTATNLATEEETALEISPSEDGSTADVAFSKAGGQPTSLQDF